MALTHHTLPLVTHDQLLVLIELNSPTASNRLCPCTTGLSLARWRNADSTYNNGGIIDLGEMSIPANGFLILCRDKAIFDAMFPGIVCDVEGASDA
jgi:hypothetical protein